MHPKDTRRPNIEIELTGYEFATLLREGSHTQSTVRNTTVIWQLSLSVACLSSYVPDVPKRNDAIKA